MNQNDREKLKNELAEIEKDIQKVVSEQELNPNELTVKTGDLPPMRPTVDFDYETEMEEIQEKSRGVIDNLVKLYLGDDDNLLNHDYISKKREKDADYFSKLDFLVNASQRTLISIMREIDMGAATPRMFEVLSMLQKEMRENIKLSSSNLSNIENFYKNMREDLGLASVPNANSMPEDDGQILDARNLNKQIDQWLKDRAQE